MQKMLSKYVLRVNLCRVNRPCSLHECADAKEQVWQRELALPTMAGARMVMTRLRSRLAEFICTLLSDLLLSTALNRNGTVKTASMLVDTSSMSARAVLPPAWATKVCPWARVVGPTANAVNPATSNHQSLAKQHLTLLL